MAPTFPTKITFFPLLFFIFMRIIFSYLWCTSRMCLLGELWIWTPRVMNIKVFIHWSFIFTGFDQQWNVIIIIDYGLCESELLRCCQRFPYCVKLSLISGYAFNFWSHSKKPQSMQLRLHKSQFTNWIAL